MRAFHTKCYYSEGRVQEVKEPMIQTYANRLLNNSEMLNNIPKCKSQKI
jgi:hypothetical protein